MLILAVISAGLLMISCSGDDTETDKGIEWMNDIDQALAIAADKDKPVIVDFTAVWCPPCQMMEDSTFSHSGVIAKMQQFIPVRIDVDKQSDIANQYNGNASKYGGIGIPNFLFLDSEGNTLSHPVGFKGPEDFLAIMDSVLVMGK